MEIVFTPWQNLKLLTVPELSQADTTLRFLPRAGFGVGRSLVEDNGQFLNRIWVQSLLRRRVGWAGGERGGGGGSCVGEVAVVAADPASVEEENDYEEDNGEEYDDEEQCPSSDLEVSVI